MDKTATGTDRVVSKCEIGVTRRAVLVAAGASAGSVTLFNVGPASALSAAGTAPPTEGFFLLYKAEGASGDNPRDRMFFIPSAWLSRFEITDQYNSMQTVKVATKIQTNNKKGGHKNWSILYSDDLFPQDVVAQSDAQIYPQDPSSGTTYLAMSISPA